MTLLDLLNETYRDEWSRRDQLASELTVPIGLLTVMGSINVYYVTNVVMDASPGTWFFLVCLAAATIFFLRSTYFVARSYHGYTYYRIPGASVLKSHHEALAEYHDVMGHAGEVAASEFQEYLCTRLAEAAEANSVNNLSRAAFLHQARQSLIYTAVLTGICAVPWLMNRTSHPTMTKIEVANPLVIEQGGK